MMNDDQNILTNNQNNFQISKPYPTEKIMKQK